MEFRLHLDTETVDQAFPDEPVAVQPDAKVHEVMKRMADSNQGSVLVCRDGQLLGVFTERDALGLMVQDADMNGPVEEVMTHDPDTLSQNESVAAAISKMSRGGYRRLPIVDDLGRPVGMMRLAGLIHYLVEHFPSIVYTLPPGPHHGMLDREGA